MKPLMSMITFFILVSPVFADDPCACTRETEDRVCKAYYELLDIGFEGMKVKVTCEPKEKKDNGKHERISIRIN